MGSKKLRAGVVMGEQARERTPVRGMKPNRDAAMKEEARLIQNMVREMKPKAHDLIVNSPRIAPPTKLIQAKRRQQVLARLRKQRLRINVATLDYKRALKDAKSENIPQTVIAETLGVSQPAVAKALKGVDAVPDVLVGMDAASPLELCERYAAGEIDQETLISELAQWPYEPTPMADDYGHYSGSISGTFDDVTVAKRMGLIEREAYEEIVARITASR